MKMKFDIAIVPKLFQCKQIFGMRKSLGFSPTVCLFSSCSFYTSAAYVQLEFGESAASIRVRLLIKCGFYTRLFGMQGGLINDSGVFPFDFAKGVGLWSVTTIQYPCISATEAGTTT